MNVNDLIGLRRAWGARPGDGSGTVDCCLLAAEVHKRLGYYDYAKDFEWVFSKYTDETFPKSFMLRWLLQNGVHLRAPEPHAVVLMDGTQGGAMGTVLDDGRVILITDRNGVVVSSQLPVKGHYFRLNK